MYEHKSLGKIVI